MFHNALENTTEALPQMLEVVRQMATDAAAESENADGGLVDDTDAPTKAAPKK